MAKALKIVGAVVAVVAIVASAGAMLAPAAAATATSAATAGGFLGMSAATLGTIGTVASIASAAIGVGMAVFGPKPGFSQAGNPLSFQTNPQSGLPYPIGRTRMSGVRMHAETYDAPLFKSESKQDILAFGVLLGAGGPMEEIETFRADKETVTFDGSGNAVGAKANYMAQKVSLGLVGASALALTFGGVAFPGWTADHKLSGIAHALWDLRYDAKGNHYGAGVPEPEWIGKWVKVYDPRKDSTFPGGSGSHRALDESTYEWSRNPALHGLTWALGRWQNGKRTLGIGAPIGNIRVADFVEAANVCDANAWHCGGVEWSTDNKWSVLKRMLQAGGAEPTMAGAMIGCRVNMPKISIATVSGEQLLERLSIATTRSRRDRFNTVIPRYRSEAHEWQVISGAPVSVAAYVTADGGQRTKEIDFPLVQAETGLDGEAQVGQLAAYEIVNSREAGPITFTTGPELVGIRTGDVVTLDVPKEGLDAQPVLIRRVTRDPASFRLTFEAETETAAKHDFALGKTTVAPPTWSPTPPDLTPPMPDAALWSLTAGYDGTGLIPAITVAGTCEFPGADTVLIQYRAVGAADWLTLGKADASAPVNQVVSGLEPSADYEARISYQSGERSGPWLTLGPVSTPMLVLGEVGRVGFLTNQAHTVAADAAGNVVSYAAAGGSFIVLEGDTVLTAGVSYSVFSETGVDVSIDATTGAYTINSMSADSGTAVLRATVAGVAIDQTYSIAKSRAGADGAGAKLLTVAALRMAIGADASGNPSPAVQTNALIAIKQNTTATVTWSVFDLNNNPRTPTTSFLSAATGDSVSQTVTQFAGAADGSGGCIIKATLTDGITLTDQISVMLLRDGAPGVDGADGDPAIGFVTDVNPGPGSFVNQTWYKPITREWFYWTGSGWTKILGDLSALSSVSTGFIATNAVTKTAATATALSRTESGYTNSYPWIDLTITTSGSPVQVYGEVRAQLYIPVADISAGGTISGDFAVTRGSSGIGLTYGSTTLADYISAGGIQLLAPTKLAEYTYHGGASLSVVHSPWSIIPIALIDDAPGAGTWRYTIWARNGAAKDRLFTNTRQFLKLMEVKR